MTQIIINKPFTYLRDLYKWSYHSLRFDKNKRNGFMDPKHFMLLEKRDLMTCRRFKAIRTGKTTKDAKYITITLLDFLDHSNIEENHLFCQYNLKCSWDFSFVKLGLKIIKNAEIVIPTKAIFPLILRNKKYNFYIASRMEDDYIYG